MAAPPTVDSDSAALEAARNAVLDTAELLENILLHLPMRTLLLSQRVSKTWQAAIARSPRIQEALFFKPIVIKDCKLKSGGKRIGLEDYSPWIDKDTGVRIEAFLNPLIDWMNFMATGRGHWEGKQQYRPESSFRKMLMTQPALKTMPLSTIVVASCAPQPDYRPRDGRPASEHWKGQELFMLPCRVGRDGEWTFLNMEHETGDAGVTCGQVDDRLGRDQLEARSWYSYVDFGNVNWKVLEDNMQLEEMRLSLKG